MKLNPRYGPHPTLSMDGDPSAVGELVIRQRRRLAGALRSLTDEQWKHPSRCDGWSSQDVALHVATTNAYWEMSIQSGVDGRPTRFMEEFDPVATPQEMVSDSAMGPDEIVELMAASTESLAACLDGLTAADWSMVAEAPPGHITVNAVAQHALWDSWTHERDVLLPLGVTPVEEADEVVVCLRYVAALTATLSVIADDSRTGGFDVSGTDPDVSFHVEIGETVHVAEGATGADFVLSGRSVDLVEALSFRRPLDPEIPTDIAWAFSGLGAVFDR